MTNEELIERFFRGRVCVADESYGFFVRPLLRKSVGAFALFSKTYQFPMAVGPSEYYFIVSVPFQGADGKHYLLHSRMVVAIAKQLKIRFVLSPHADANHFQKYMETRINCDLLALANDLRTGSYASILRFKEFDLPKPIFGLAGGPDSCFAVPENYQKLMGNIYILLEWESIFELPKNQVALIDTDETQSLWRWLIKENPVKEDRELFLKIYTLSRLLVPNKKMKK